MKYWVESSHDFEDKEKKYPECIVIGADYGENGTESIGCISLDDSIEIRPTIKSEMIEIFERINLDLKEKGEK